MGIPAGSVVKNLPANAGRVRDSGSIPRSGWCPGGGHGNPLQYSCLENPMYRGPCTVHVQSMGSQGVRHDLATKPPPLPHIWMWYLICFFSRWLSSCLRQFIQQFISSWYEIKPLSKFLEVFISRWCKLFCSLSVWLGPRVHWSDEHSPRKVFIWNRHGSSSLFFYIILTIFKSMLSSFI